MQHVLCKNNKTTSVSVYVQGKEEFTKYTSIIKAKEKRVHQLE